MTKRRGKMVSLTVMIWPDQMQIIIDKANQQNGSMGDVIRKLIDSGIDTKSLYAKTKGEKK